MSVDNVKAFYDKVEGDKGLQRKVFALRKKGKGDKEAVAELIKIASTAGFKFTPAHLSQARKQAPAKLSDDELKSVAGGGQSAKCDVLELCSNLWFGATKK